MEIRPVVTVGAINYNNARYVIETLDSIAAQTYPDIQLVIVDDCSTDNSPQLIEQWLQTYKGEYRFVRHPKNKGVCATCNDVLKNASGKYISIIATDDVMMPEKIERQVAVLENASDDVGVVYSDAYLMDDNGVAMEGMFIDKYRKFNAMPSGNIFDELVEGNFIPAMATMYRRSCIDVVGCYDEDLSFEDYDMWLRLSKQFKVIYSDYISARYRIRSNSLMSVTRNWDTSTIKILSKHLDHRPGLMKKIIECGIGLYCNKNRDGLIDLKKLRSKSRILRVITWLHYWQVPQVIGLFIIKQLDRQ